MSVAAQYFLEWESTRAPESGTYLASAGVALEGPDRMPLFTGVARPINDPVTPRNRSNWGGWAPIAWISCTRTSVCSTAGSTTTTRGGCRSAVTSHATSTPGTFDFTAWGGRWDRYKVAGRLVSTFPIGKTPRWYRATSVWPTTREAVVTPEHPQCTGHALAPGRRHCRLGSAGAA
ncbi:hypothetical protein [Pseudomonas sp. 273]|uniref:hypothetical protein n=1 Tax=Pseudomonas sp. 273 TaxID=75692 RepID=UPI003211F3A9